MAEYAIKYEPQEGKRIRTHGVDWGPDGIIMLYRNGDYAVVKVPGHQAWASMLDPKHYYPTSYAIAQLFEGELSRSSGYEGDWGYMEYLYKTQVEPGHGWARAIADLKKEVDELAAGIVEEA